MKEVLVLLSGGLDSATCLALAVQRYGADKVLALTVSYGQKHKKELDAARRLAQYYQVEQRLLDLEPLFEGSNCSLLAWSDQAIPQESYSQQLAEVPDSPVSTYVPFRNGLFLSAAASVALSAGCQRIYYGIHRDDAAGSAYPDCSDAFNAAIKEAIYLGSGQALTVEAPFVEHNKADIVRLGTELGVPYELSWSCYEGREKACGRCGTCIDRRAAFAANGLRDPLPYEDEEDSHEPAAL